MRTSSTRILPDGGNAASHAGLVPSGSGKLPKLTDRVRHTSRAGHNSHHTQQTYHMGGKDFNHYHSVRRPAEMAEPGVEDIDFRPPKSVGEELPLKQVILDRDPISS